MSSTVAQKTVSVTLVIEKFSQLATTHRVPFKINGLSHNYFGIHPKTVVYNGEHVAFYLLCYNNTIIKYKVNVSILNQKNVKIFSKEYSGEFGNITENYFNLMSRSELLSQNNGYLHYDTLTLLCEFEVFEKNQANQKIQKDLSHLSQDFQTFLTDGKFTDFTLVVGKDEKEFHVHKAILAARSSVFAAMFEHDCEEKRQNKVNITDMDEEVCAEVLRFVYSGTVESLDRYAMELLDAADKYQLHSLKTICEQYMCNNLSAETAVNVLILADLHQTTALKAKCIEFISANVGQVQSTDGWKVLDTKPNLLKELFVYLAMKK